MRSWIALAVALVVLGMGASYYYVSQRHQVAGVGTAPAEAGEASRGHFSLLMLGVDERPDDVGRSDTIILSSVDLDAHQVKLLSVPRDTYVQIPGHGYDKVNHAYAFGKEKLSLETLDNFLDVSIDHYVVINLQGFQRVVQALGGVTIDVEKNMDYDDPYDEPPLHIHLKKGVQHLDPAQAEEYVRFRHDEESDFGRARRQQQMLKALAQEALRPANLLKLPQIVSIMYQSVRTDLSVTQVLQIASLVKDWNSGAVEAEGSLKGDDYWHEGVSYLKADLVEVRTQVYKMISGEDPPADFLSRAQADSKTYLAAFVPDKPAPPPVATVTPTPGGKGGTDKPPAPQPKPGGQWVISLVDGSGKNLATRYVSLLNQSGLRVVSVARTRAPVTESQVILRSNDTALRDKLQSLFPKARFELQPASKDAEAPAEIVLGSDLDTTPTPATTPPAR